MKKIYMLIFFVISLFRFDLNAQWISKASLPGSARSFSGGFAVGSKVYVAGGFDGSTTLQDFWEYDTGANTWTQKTDLVMGFRSGAVTFTINGKGYMCTGNNGFQYLNDLWEYDPNANSWNQKASFPGDPRDEAVGFVIGNNAYVGTGQQFIITPNSSFTVVYNDFYEYNSITDTWAVKANIPGSGRAYAVGISAGNKGYAGLGGNDDQTLSYTDFYEYDPLLDTWTVKASYTGTGRADAGIFASGTDVYVIGGINFPNFSITAACKKYNTLTDAWSNITGYGGGAVVAPICVNANGEIYAGTGANSGQNPRTDWWKFNPLTTSLIENNDAVLTIFPNPFSDFIQVTVPGLQAKHTLNILNETGRIVLSQNIYKSTTVQTQSLAAGRYEAILQKAGGTILAKKALIKK